MSIPILWPARQTLQNQVAQIGRGAIGNLSQ